MTLSRGTLAVFSQRRSIVCPAPSVQQGPRNSKFSNTAVGKSSTLTLTISNTGTASLTVSSSGANNGAFQVTSALPITVAAGGMATITVVFTPQTTGAQNATVFVASNDPVNPSVTLQATGTGFIAGSGGAISVTSNNGIGPLNLTTAGTTDWAQYGPAGLTAKASGGHQIGTLMTVGSVASAAYGGDPRTLTWTDGSPQAMGPTNFGVHIYGNPNQSGNGYTFTVPAGTAPSTLVVYLSGTVGSATFTAHLSDNSTPDYTQTVPFTNFQDLNYTLIYNSGSANATLTLSWIIQSNPSGNMYVGLAGMALAAGSTGSGGGTPTISVPSAPVTFGSVTAGQSAITTFSIANTGSAALSVTSISSSNSAFTVTSPSIPFTVAAGGSTAVSVKFAPAIAGAQTGTLTIASSDSAHGSVTVSLSGTGTALDPTLAGWWKFDEGTGTTVSDSSGNGNTGAFSGGVTWTTGKFGDAISLDGATGFIQGSGPGTGFPIGASARTITAWVNVSNAPSADNAILHYGTGSGTPAAASFHLYMTGSPAGHIGLGNGYGFGTIMSSQSVADGNWHLVVGVYDGGASAGGDNTLHIYIDGVLDTSGVPSTTPATGTASNWRIGQFIASSTPFHGLIDDVKIYSRALGASEIAGLMTNQ